MAWRNLYDLSPRLRAVLVRLVPTALRGWLRANYVLFLEMGHWRSLRTRRVEWPGEGPVPWFTYAAVEYLRQLDFRDKAVFEYGSGHSSLFWANRGARLTTIDADPVWNAWVRQRLPANAVALCETEQQPYVESILAAGTNYDVIVLDGACRPECVAPALQRLGAGGLIILDNSDFYADAARQLRESGLLQVDFFDFSAAESFRQVTSLFFSRDFRLATREPVQPCPPVGGMPVAEFHRIRNQVVPKTPPRT